MMSNAADSRLTFDSTNEADTDRLGRALAAVLPSSAVVALHGPLGAGKTRLVQAIAEGAGIERAEVVSPTFVLIQEHYGRQTIYHIDAYRLSGAEEFRQLGGEEYFYFGGPGWTFVEWANRIADCLPADLLCITIEPLEGEQRRIEITAGGEQSVRTLAALAGRLELG
jgi:tRNA threonylcarbamoyladenosine biosynthesis protein TsaE